MKLSRIQSQIKTSLLVPALAVAILGQATPAKAQTYSTPLTWQGMEMPSITFNTDTHTLSEVAQTTNIAWLAVNTLSTGKGDPTATTPANFDPSQPWSVLNGTAFSRRLGWWTSQSTLAADIQSVYGADAGIWIEKISASAGLKTYLAVGKYGVNTDNTTTVDPAIGAYQVIFGTAGSSTKWKWDYQMDHNANAVSLGDIIATNQLFTATYKIYIGDSTGAELPAAVGASTTTTWTWQAPATLVAPSPVLQSKVVLSWSGTATNYVAESADSLDSTSWTTVTNKPVVIDDKTVILIDPAGSQRFFRLHLAN